MKKLNKILIIGAGRSATDLIDYILEKSTVYNWQVTVADANFEAAKAKVGDHPNGTAIHLDIMDEAARKQQVQAVDLVVSLLPAFLHIKVAHDCIALEKHLITASYISKEMKALDEAARAKGLNFMGEIGLDPGIDHMSAMQKIDEIKEAGGKLLAFRSYTGGLVAPECDNNPWHYKFTWNPRNVVLAGQGTAQYLEDRQVKYIPYHRLFKDRWSIDVPGMGAYEMYANRDSLAYEEIYSLQGIPTLIRGTLRTDGYCHSWNALIELGLTDNTFTLTDLKDKTYRELVDAYVGAKYGDKVEDKVAKLLGVALDSEIMQKLTWLGLFSDEKIGLESGTPAQILEKLLLTKWSLEDGDIDMIIMQHEFEYELNGEHKKLTSTLVTKGKDEVHTAMARLVGIPLAIYVKEVMIGNISMSGVNIPVMKSVYEPVLEELKEYGVEFKEQEEVLS